MSDVSLARLIQNLEERIRNKDVVWRNIKDCKLLISSLKELNRFIGNHEIKQSVCDQVSHIIHNKTLVSQGKVREDDVMLNTALYGPPGVGKTLIGRCLSKIWYSLGYLDGSRSKSNRMGAGLRNILAGDDDSSSANTGLLLYGIFIAIMVVVAMISMIRSMYTNIGLYWTIAVIALIAIIIATVVYVLATPTTNKNNNSGVNRKVDDQDEYTIDADDLFTVVSRSDFVDKYVGWTDKKTLKLLNDNLGKVLFVDEAYSLVSDPRDSFGLEAINTINKFLSEHPREIIVIFAGYKDLMDSCIFDSQPGLRRRFMWHFNCNGYNGEELFDIFRLQLRQKQRDIVETDLTTTRELLSSNSTYFPNFGGDTERLCFFAELEQSKDYIADPDNCDPIKLNYDQVSRALSRLKDHNPDAQKKQKSQQESTNPISKMFELLRMNDKQTTPY